MTEVACYAAGAAAAFAVLLAVSLAVSVVPWAISTLVGDRNPGPGWNEVRENTRFALAWSVLVFLPVGLAMRFLNTGASALAWTLAGIGIAGFGRAFLSARLKADPVPLRLFWAILEGLLLVLGFRLFALTQDICRSSG
jgi:hypothetical protein